jgi:class 3 adenylate cyclase
LGLKDDLTSEVKSIFKSAWKEEAASSVPEPKDLTLNANHAKELDGAVVLYSDIDGSTTMVEQLSWSKSAELYKAYLRCASQIIRAEKGVITAYDGDRVMGIFYERTKNTNAVRAALKINYAVHHIIQTEYAAYYTGSNFVLKHVVGVDSSKLHAARVGVHGDNDLVWVGRAANIAAKLCALSEGHIWITNSVYNAMLDSAKYHNGSSETGTNMWEKRLWTKMDNMEIYRSTYSVQC